MFSWDIGARYRSSVYIEQLQQLEQVVDQTRMVCLCCWTIVCEWKEEHANILDLPLLALMVWSTISAAPRSCSRACWYNSFCFSISFSYSCETGSIICKFTDKTIIGINRQTVHLLQNSLLPLHPRPLHHGNSERTKSDRKDSYMWTAEE